MSNVESDWIDATATLSDGRKLGYVAYGEPTGAPVFHFHGALTSRWEGFWIRDAARAAGVRLITVDRPGVGASSFAPGRRITDWPRDVAQLAAHLSIERFSVMGVSGGGPYALACAAALPEQVRRVALIAGAAPLSNPEVFALMSARQRMVLGRMMHSPRALAGFIFGLKCMPDLLRVLVLGAFLGGLSPADYKLVTDPAIGRAKRLLPAVAGLAPFGATVDGPAWDGHLHSMPWGFELSSVRVPVDLWYAEDDRIVSAAMGRWLAPRLAQAHTHYLPDDGHLSLIIARAGEYLADLASAMRSPEPVPAAS